ncbi:50S ribosome-binding GTPase (macronuclear) [Tetrahymena thermophila SB210]|uniref:50S ribosome-binding GTPase n=1 Tax=Tetrahymena thermophila (strain SB210) TaxID=312017 RepID=I7M9C9_TETTS|nr:50S ribosome-binding GTPase [Tetrahymena thermophila SB210]EAS01348.2 50S ribosome-binding GTPase [Tetrahymena thermophila SB210]|eukprot:XP_001021593.2 50S ribosome-binding GTPase [Tetrahymena thermophila SB210]
MSTGSQKQKCNLEGHELKQFIAVCISSSCHQSQKLICSKCILEGLHSSHQQEIIYLKDYVDYEKSDIFDIPIWKKEGEEVFNKICDWVLDENQEEREEKIEAIFSAFRKNVNILIDEAEKKYKERLGRDSATLLELTEKFIQVSPIVVISEAIKQLSDDQLDQNEFEKFLNQKIVNSEERKLQIQELEETFNDIIKIEQSLNFKDLSKQLVHELPQLMKADKNLDIFSPSSSPKRKSSNNQDQVINSGNNSNDHENLPLLKKQSSSSTKRERKKFLLLGKSNIGKSTLINTLIHREFQPDISAHIQRNMVYVYDLALCTKKILITLQEISGDEEIIHQNKSLLKNVDGVILLYDSNESLQELDKWITLFIEFGLHADQHNNFPFILTKIIKNEENQEVSQEQLDNFTKEHCIRSQQQVDTSNLNSIINLLENISQII